MRISDWSSDVFSSDLTILARLDLDVRARGTVDGDDVAQMAIGIEQVVGRMARKLGAGQSETDIVDDEIQVVLPVSARKPQRGFPGVVFVTRDDVIIEDHLPRSD